MKIFGNKDTDFMGELEAATRLRPATPVILMLFSVAALAVLFLVWAAVSKVEVITRGEGQVVPSQEIQVVQSLEGGILSELLVREGEQVKKGQTLMRLSDTQFSSEERGTESKFLSLAAKKARLQAEAKGESFVMPADIAEKSPAIARNEEDLYKSRMAELKNAYAILDDRISKANAELSGIKAEIGRLSENRRMLQNELDVTRRMVEQRAAPKLEQMQKERELSDVSGQINAASARQQGLASELEAARKEKQSQEGSFRSQALTELNEVETEIAGLQENLKSMGDRVDRREIRSPVDGIVNNIALTTIGGVVEPAMRLVEIVPLDDELKIMARVAPDEVAFLHPGQDVKVKITAYDPQRYGALPGKLVRIGANSVNDREGNIFFEIEVRTEKNHMSAAGKPLPITPGMVAHTEVITGRRTILEYLLKPILRTQDVALTEH
jgi:membrane fusion protein, adhesin transport system